MSSLCNVGRFGETKTLQAWSGERKRGEKAFMDWDILSHLEHQPRGRWTTVCPLPSPGNAQCLHGTMLGYVSIWGHCCLSLFPRTGGLFSRCRSIQAHFLNVNSSSESRQFASSMSLHPSSPAKTGIVLGASGRRFLLAVVDCIWKLDS